MKKILGIVVLVLILCDDAYARKGKGEVSMSDRSIDHFIKYIRGGFNKNPLSFILSNDGSWTTYWFCPASTCQDPNPMKTIRRCEEETGDKCGVFARRRTIVWDNGIKPKKASISSKMSDQEIRDQLKEWGFLGNNFSMKQEKEEKVKSEMKFPKSKINWSNKRKEAWIKMMTGGDERFKAWADSLTTLSGTYNSYGWSANNDGLNETAKTATKNCSKFQKKYLKQKKMDQNDICIVNYINGKPTTDKEKIKFAKNFYGKEKATTAFENNASLLENSFIKKVKKEKKEKEKKKIVKKYELKGERSIALSWEGYEDLIAGTVKFDETDYRGTLNLPLPNNEGICDGTYSLQEGGKGTWQIACTNNMGAAGTLKWIKDGGVTGIGRDHNDKKVKFTVSKKS